MLSFLRRVEMVILRQSAGTEDHATWAGCRCREVHGARRVMRARNRTFLKVRRNIRMQNKAGWGMSRTFCRHP